MARILFGLLLLQIFTLAHCQCLNGWQELFGNCYLFVNVRRSHNLGASICERHGSKLANPNNVSELKYLNETAANKFKNASQFWIGYSKGQDNDLDGYWDNFKRNSSEGYCVAMNNLGLFMVDNCFRPYFFVCQRKACGQMECLAGYVYNRSSDACIACPKGTYKSKRGYHPCIACTGSMTTFRNASTRKTDCLIPNCPAGEEPTGDYLSCKKCSLGYYKSDSSSIYCIQCPIGTTTLQTGATSASQCSKEIVPNAAILNTVVIVIELQYSFLNCELKQAFYEGEIKSLVEKKIEKLSKEWSYCIGTCLVTVNVNCPTSNRKKRATEIGNAEVQVRNVKPDADSKTKDERTLTENIFTQNCKADEDEDEMPGLAKLVSCAVNTSCKYSKLVSNKCELCPAGTKAIETGCVDCPEGTYSGIDQRNCTNCSFPLTSKSRSNSSSQCLSKCILDSTYCKNGGICSKAEHDKHHICFCSEKFSGEQCEIYNEFCPAGTKAIETGCVDCPEGTYSGINQRNCTNCSFPLTSKSRSNSSSQCLSKCILDSTYCKNGGICSKAVHDKHHICFCSRKFSGEQCEIYNEIYDHGKWWIFVVIGCIGLILVIIQIVAVLINCLRKKHEEKKRMSRRARNDHSAQFFYWFPMQGHRANHPCATNWENIRKSSY